MSDADAFLDIAGKFPLLDQREEIELGRRIQKWLKDPDPTPATVKDGLRARERFVNCNLRLVANVAKKYTNRLENSGMTFADILQEGTIGLQRAAEKYDPECGYKMSTYAYWWIKQRINRALHRHTGMIRITYTAKMKHYKFTEAAKLGGSIDEILERAGLRQRDLQTIKAVQMCRDVDLLDDYSQLQ
jgi:RNA polymerase sigma factor (sigma-70 family)